MTRSILIIASVAALSFCLAQLENAHGQRLGERVDITWVRTNDGWEPSDRLWLESQPVARPSLHPVLVASFQLSASLFVLTAFPGTSRRQ